MDISNVMNFFQKIQDYFKLDDAESKEYKDDDIVKRSGDAPRQIENTESIPVIAPAEPIIADSAQVQKIFDKVVEITNEAVPKYLGSALDKEKQKKFLFNALDQSVKDYLASLEKIAEARCLAQWKNEREEQKKEMERLREQTRDLEAKRTEMNEQKLSADRQKRALTDRVADLEGQIDELLAEKEQLEIENKSLLNKAKVANIYETDMEAMRQEMAELRTRVASDELEAENVDLKHQISSLTAENNKLSESVKNAKLKDDMGSNMMNDLQKKASEALKKAKESEAKIEDLNHIIKEKDARISDLEIRISQGADMEHNEEEYVSQAQLEEIASQLEKFQEVKDGLENRIRTLKSKLDESKKENETLRATIKSNLYTQAQREQALTDEIGKLRDNSESSTVPNAEAENPIIDLTDLGIESTKYGSKDTNGHKNKNRNRDKNINSRNKKGQDIIFDISDAGNNSQIQSGRKSDSSKKISDSDNIILDLSE